MMIFHLETYQAVSFVLMMAMFLYFFVLLIRYLFK